MSFTPNLEKRIRLLFRFYDLNKVGRLDRKDIEAIIENVSRLFKSDTAEQAKHESDQWWAMFEKVGVNGPISEEQFVTASRILYERDFQKFRQFAFKLYDASFSLIDHDKDNKISLDDIVKFYAFFNVENIDRIKEVFAKIDLTGDGFLSRDEWILARLDYVTRDDPDHDFGFLLDFSSPVPEDKSTGRLTPKLLKRYKIGFRFFDINKDGFLTLSDILLICDNLCDLHHGGEEERAALHHSATEWWKQVEPMATDGKIAEEHYVYWIITKLVTDLNGLRLAICLFHRPWIGIADRNCDGLISEDEFLKFYAAANVKDSDKVKEIFKQVDVDGDGSISKEEWILANFDYWTIDDPTYDYGFLFDVE